MTRPLSHTVATRLPAAVALLFVWTTLLCARLRRTYAQHRDLLRAAPERGSISVEKAVITAVSLGLALALMAAITAVVNKYTGMIR